MKRETLEVSLKVDQSKSRTQEAPAAVWDELYKRDNIPWRSAGLTSTARRLLRKYAPGPNLLEIGCGVGDDRISISEIGFKYHGLDISRAAICGAKLNCIVGDSEFVAADFFRWQASSDFDIAYDKGVFHGLGGVRRRGAFIRRVARVLSAHGIWLTVCGSADRRRIDISHGAIYLRDLIGPAEIYFEVLEVVKSKYGLRDRGHDFDAWYAVFRRR